MCGRDLYLESLPVAYGYIPWPLGPLPGVFRVLSRSEGNARPSVKSPAANFRPLSKSVAKRSPAACFFSQPALKIYTQFFL